MTLALKIVGYCLVHATLSAVGTTGILSFAENGGDPRVVRLTRDVENLSVEVQSLKQKIDGIGRQHVSNDATQYVLVQSPDTAAEVERERLKDIRIREQLAQMGAINGL